MTTVTLAIRRASILYVCLLAFSLCLPSANVQAAVGRTAGQFSVGAIGDAQYSIPLWTPPGTNGLAPSLSLNYSSANGNAWLGIGFTIPSLSVISRCNATPAQDVNGQGVNFVPLDKYCLDGQRLRHVTGTYGSTGSTYQTEIESFRLVTVTGASTYGPTSWTVKTKDGITYEYGVTVDSRVRLISGSGSLSSVPFTWAVNRIRDSANNFVDFTYIQDATNGGHYPQEIRWTGNTNGTAAQYKVVFVNETTDRPDIIRFHVGSSVPVGAGATSFFNYHKRLGRIDVFYIPTNRIVRKYQLTYEPAGGTAGLSRLQSVQEFGLDGSDSLTPTTFTWITPPSWSAAEATTGQSVPAGVTPFVMDISGDGRDDLVWSSSATSGGGTWQFKIADGSGGFGGAVNTGISNTNYNQAALIQWDGDNKQDLIVPLSGGTWWALRANGSGFDAPIATGIAASALTVFADINGDSLDDLVRKFNGLSIRLRSGSSFGAESTGFTPPWAVSNIYPITSKQRHDFDGDGLEDVVIVIDQVDALGNHTLKTQTVLGNSTNLRAGTDLGVVSYVGTGDFNGDQRTDLAWISGGTLRTTINGVSGPSASVGAVVIIDWNGDGKDDALRASGSVAYSTGTGFATPVLTGLSGILGQVGDIDGDTFEDLVGVDAGVIKTIRHSTVAPWQFRDLLQEVRDGYGVAATFTYGSLNDPTVHTTAIGPLYPQASLNDASRNMVKTVAATDGTGTGTTFTLTFTYEGALWDDRGRGFLGFAKRTTIDSREGYNLKTEENFEQTWPLVGLTKKVTVKQSSGTLISDTNTTWKALTYSSGFSARHFPYVSASTTLQYELNGTHFRTVTSTLPGLNGVDGMDAASGLVKDVTTTTLEVATGLNAGSSKSERMFHSSILNDSLNWCLGRPLTSQLSSSHTLTGGGMLTRTTARSWDPVKCRLDSSTVQPGDVQWQVGTALLYDGFGNVSSRTITGAGMGARTVAINWGSAGQFPILITNALSQATTQGFEPDRGLQKSITDPNILMTSWTHDTFGRRTLETRPDGTKTATSYLSCPTCDSRIRWRVEEQLKRSDNVVMRTDNLYFDQFDRLLFHYGQLPGGASAVNTVNFDARGRVRFRKNPTWSGQASTANGQWRIDYDALDRSVAERLYNASGVQDRFQTHAFNGLAATTTDFRNEASTQVLTAWGNVAQVTDAESGATKYGYNAFGEVVETKDAYNSVTSSITYNVRGMKISMTDADMGIWEYLPNALGEVAKIRDAKTTAPNWTTQYLFDPLGRVTQRTEGEGNTDWTWGTSAAAWNVGQLASVAGPGYSEVLTYDNKSRISRRDVTTDTAYRIDYGYNTLSGFLQSVTYPTSTSAFRFQLIYEYTYGQLYKVRRSDGPLTEYWKLNTVDARGNALDELLGNNIQVISGYSPLTGMMESRTAGPSGSATVQDLDYEWDLNGNLWKRHERRQTLSEVFEYDGLNRLTSSTLNGSPNLTVGYDLIGNITSKSDVPGTWSYHDTKKHAVIAAGTANTYTFDANGNAITKNGNTIAWTSYNLPSSISGSGVSSQFSYGPDRERFKQIGNYPGRVETTHYVGGILEKLVASAPAPALTEFKHYIAGPSGLVAVYTRRSNGTEDTYYFTKDHLGSIDSVTNQAGAIQVRLSFDAFGKRRKEVGWAGAVLSGDLTAIQSTSRRGYTEHEGLDNLGLVHMNGRVQDPAIGRFLSADPFVQAPYYSQSLNRYSYVFNAPTSLVDPSGFCGATSIVVFIGQSESGGLSPSFTTPCPDMNFMFVFAGGGGHGGGGGANVSGCQIASATPGSNPPGGTAAPCLGAGPLSVGPTLRVQCDEASRAESGPGDVRHRGRSTPETRCHTIDAAFAYLLKHALIGDFEVVYVDEFGYLFIRQDGKPVFVSCGDDPTCAKWGGVQTAAFTRADGTVQANRGAATVLAREALKVQYHRGRVEQKTKPWANPLEKAIWTLAHENWHVQHPNYTGSDKEALANRAGEKAVVKFRGGQ